MGTTRSKKTKPTSTYKPTATGVGIFDEVTKLTPERFEAAKAIGETLASEQEKRLAVRQQRQAIADAATHGIGTTEKPGRQTSPELASLAAKYINFEADDTARIGEELARDVRSLAASVLSQAHDD